MDRPDEIINGYRCKIKENKAWTQGTAEQTLRGPFMILFIMILFIPA